MAICSVGVRPAQRNGYLSGVSVIGVYGEKTT